MTLQQQRERGAVVEFAIFDPEESTKDPRERHAQVAITCYVTWNEDRGSRGLFSALSPDDPDMRGEGETVGAAVADYLSQRFHGASPPGWPPTRG